MVPLDLSLTFDGEVLTVSPARRPAPADRALPRTSSDARSAPPMAGTAGLFTCVLFALLALAGSASAGTLSDAAVIAAAGADVYSTHVALQRGGVESNPMLGGVGGQALLKAGIVTVALYQCHRWEKGGHRNRARVVRYSLIVLWGSAAAWNLTRGGRR